MDDMRDKDQGEGEGDGIRVKIYLLGKVGSRGEV